jgi:hypothetical protein
LQCKPNKEKFTEQMVATWKSSKTATVQFSVEHERCGVMSRLGILRRHGALRYEGAFLTKGKKG